MSARSGLLFLALAACSAAEAQPKSGAPPTEALHDVDTAAQPAPRAGQSLAAMLRSLHVRVCVRSDVPPFSYFGPAGLQGFDIALAQQLVDELSIDYKQALKAEWVVVTAAERMQRLQDGACDLVVASFSYTKERAAQVATSKVYVKTDKVLLGATKITRATPVIAKLEGATGDAGIKGRVQTFKTYLDITHAMDMGEIDYVVTDRPIAEHLIRSTVSSFKVSKTLAEDAESYVIAVGSGATHTELLAAVNRGLENLAQTGRLALLERRWL